MSNETERLAAELDELASEGELIHLQSSTYICKKLTEAAALLRAQQPVRWQPIDGAPIGDYWFALDCGHVVMGVKAGSRLVDWESSIDNDCCADAAATCCMPVIPPTPPQGASNEG
jgi:hypothetical protein